MKKITVNWDVSQTSGTEHISLEQMNIQSVEEWNALSDEEQEEKLQEALDDIPERVCIIVDTFY